MRPPAVSLRSVHLRIAGLVQGVSYRVSARDEALRLGLSGWVRNLLSGDVEAVAQGPSPAVEAFCGWCRRGPPEARVTDVQTAEVTIDAALKGFEMRR